MNEKIVWAPVVERAAQIVRSYNLPVTLRQLFYRLVSEQLLSNTQADYKTLSSKTAALRRRGEFPALFDRGRRVLQPSGWDSVAAGMAEFVEHHFRLDRTAGQEVQVWLAVEKNALAGLIEDWFDDLGVPVLPLGGYGSESIDREVLRRVERDGRPAVLIIAGDFDASGMDISRNFIAQTDCWATTSRIGLSEAQVAALSLPVLAGKPKDSRATGFIARHPVIHAAHVFARCGDPRCHVDHAPGTVPVQIELDAVEPQMLHDWYRAAIDEHWDTSVFEAVQEREDSERAQELLALRRRG
jgi:hypothetical protein